MDALTPWITIGILFGISLTASAIKRHLEAIDASLKWQNARFAAQDQHAASQHTAPPGSVWPTPPSA